MIQNLGQSFGHSKDAVTTSITGTKMNRRNFNMIEILLAMAVISIGFLSVISLLSIGLKTHRKAQDNFYVSLAAETMANYAKSQCELYDLCIYVAKEGSTPAKPVHSALIPDISLPLKGTYDMGMVSMT